MIVYDLRLMLLQNAHVPTLFDPEELVTQRGGGNLDGHVECVDVFELLLRGECQPTTFGIHLGFCFIDLVIIV